MHYWIRNITFNVCNKLFMETLNAIYKELFADGSWKYYKDMTFNQYPFFSEEIANQFVNNYFQTGNKIAVIDPTLNFDSFKNIHTLSTFFLGIFLKKIVPDIGTINPKFEYFWYLSCLYHDYGYYVENDIIRFPLEKNSLNSIKSNLKISFDVLHDSEISPHSSGTVKNYFKYCRKELHFINHGIVGGLLLYDRLRKNLNEAKRKAKAIAKENKTTFNETNFIYKGLHWSILHIDWFKSISGIIIAHNIWFCTEEKDIAIYKSSDLNDLIIINQTEKRLKKSEHGLLFLLCLADTIEPSKYFSQLQPLCVLDKLKIEYDYIKQNIVIEIIDNCLDYDKYYKKIESLKKWLAVDVTRNGSVLKITIEE